MVQANKMIDKVAVKVEKKHHLKNRKLSLTTSFCLVIFPAKQRF